MVRRHTPQQQYQQAYQIAADHGLLIAEKVIKSGLTYYTVVTNSLPPRYIGSCATPEGLFRLVSSHASGYRQRKAEAPRRRCRRLQTPTTPIPTHAAGLQARPRLD